VIALSAAEASAQEWYEAYRDGVKALAQGRADRAVSLLEYAVAKRPQPGRNVVTYGTNVVEQYHPYLRLGDAYVQQRDLAGARSALKRSETWGLEPADERRRLAARIDELAARLAPPVPATTPAPPPTTAREAPAEAAATPPPPIASAPASPPAAVPSAAPSAALRSREAPSPRATPAAGSAPAPPSVSGTIEIVSQPPGVTVYLDDELVGTTDLEWGRLVRSGVTPGRHRIRLALSGHQDLTDEIDVAAGARADVRRRLSPERPAADHRPLLFGGIAVVLLALTVWALRRSPAGAAAATPARPVFDAAGPTPPRVTPPGMGSPGVSRDAQGVAHFGEYRLIEPLGRGGMASVYKAERRGEVYALKRPLPAFLEEPEFLERFLREAEIGRTLHHPNIVRILERGEVEGVPYFTMELVPGETLQARLQRLGALEPRVAAGLVVQIAEALDYAHLKGVVHRDLKPSNVMVLPDGTVKVMDYGIARVRRFEGLTLTGAFLGSPDYVAPEAIEGRNTDGRSDLYSLGVLFFEALAGRRPFLADTPFAILRQHLTEPPPALATLRPGIPADLEAVVQRLLSKTPEERYAGAEELVLALRDFLNRAA
jgi:Protein kinase domain/PEGA domain